MKTHRNAFKGGQLSLYCRDNITPIDLEGNFAGF
jgi:hypothetical protein